MIQSYTWKDLNINDYLIDCFDEIQSVKCNSKNINKNYTNVEIFQVQQCIDDYKYCNIEIVDICEDISNLTIFKIDQVQILELKDLRTKIETIKYAI